MAQCPKMFEVMYLHQGCKCVAMFCFKRYGLYPHVLCTCQVLSLTWALTSVIGDKVDKIDDGVLAVHVGKLFWLETPNTGFRVSLLICIHIVGLYVYTGTGRDSCFLVIVVWCLEPAYIMARSSGERFIPEASPVHMHAPPRISS